MYHTQIETYLLIPHDYEMRGVNIQFILKNFTDNLYIKIAALTAENSNWIKEWRRK